MVFKFESRAEATALLRRRSRDAAVALLNKEFTAQRWTLRKELKLSVRPLVTLRYFRRAVGAVRAPAPGARELCAGGAVLVVAYAVALVARGAVGARAARHAARALAAASYCLWWFVCGGLSCTTHYGSGSAPPVFGAGYVPLATWWKIGFGMSIMYIAIFLGVGFPWFKIIGLM